MLFMVVDKDIPPWLLRRYSCPILYRARSRSTQPSPPYRHVAIRQRAGGLSSKPDAHPYRIHIGRYQYVICFC